MNIRHATPEDLPDLRELRNWYIANSNATFDVAPLSAEAMQAWFSQFGRGPHRLLVAEQAGGLLGYCSSQRYRAHPAFDTTVETSIYAHPQAARRGVGSALYQALFEGLAGQGLHRAVVGIALPNAASLRLHEKFGFRPVGVFSEYATEHGQFISSQWLERGLSA
ncbi:MAG: GNAT family N-acetyltransferase [Roseateles asaccharophilus]|uniref:GNAT family N-acetyltransferase n=1 Tax=Roseateles asaccharophilus TaxID=582607 RepID=UPI003918BDCD